MLTDNGIAFADLPKDRGGPTAYWSGLRAHLRRPRIAHKLTKPYHFRTNGQAEQMNRTIKDATLKVFHQPFEAIAHAWTKDPPIFKINPRYFIPGPNT